MSSDRGMDKNVVQKNNGLINHKKNEILCNNVDELRDYYA